ncbi:hydroxymethylglutaryl-CoA reductase, degradative [Nocardioides silvaticus]|uniref:3-hydroxy-3-methylglutaryl coenzyme A reductase n=1 Tax=Nocardioides silvaticus TaxID=2201891 RepID=A0A316T9U9_9ACTN|nr:hydroxymethylglutaryl-CoA reductase, degradative [Nocardioides silvaticus]PWN01150.1 hydroxymethylglutaryl-CoA reductase, degradative [Nocardioides silvaticus]
MTSSRMSGFRDLGVEERRKQVAAFAGLADEDLRVLDPGHGLLLEQAEHMVENVVGVLGIPVGIATNFVVGGREVLVPMATEEPSVVAAASNLARMTRDHGGFITSATPPLMQAQIQVLDVPDPAAARQRLLVAAPELMALADEQDPALVAFGGGVRDLVVREVPSSRQTYVVVHLVVDVRDAMGANAVNTMAEAVAPRVAEIAGGRTLLRILTNKADRRVTRVSAVFDRDLLGGPEVVENMLDAAELAVADPYRAATHNKGIMNGITAVVLATGNDTRAVEAGAHSHAITPDGRYTSMSRYERTADGHLVGTLELPMPVGLVGGATKVHPTARANVAITGVTTAAELAEIILAVGLAQNAGALRALATEGIQRGHMSLHARNVAAAAGARPEEIAVVVERMVAERAIRAEFAEQVLAEMRSRG